MAEFNNFLTNLSAIIKIRNTPEDCFFTFDCGTNWCPGWAIGDVTLPLAVTSNQYILVWDIAGTTYWVSRNKVKYRHNCPMFDYTYYRNFDWNKWQKFPSLGIKPT